MMSARGCMLSMAWALPNASQPAWYNIIYAMVFGRMCWDYAGAMAHVADVIVEYCLWALPLGSQMVFRNDVAL